MYVFKHVRKINEQLKNLGYEITMSREGYGSGYIESTLKKDKKVKFILHFYKGKKFAILKIHGEEKEEIKISEIIKNAIK